MVFRDQPHRGDRIDDLVCHYWTFLHQYLHERFGEQYCLLPEPSLRLLTGDTVVPGQLAVMRRTPGQQVLQLLQGTSLIIYQDRTGFPERTVEVNGVRAMELHAALSRVSEAFFRSDANTAAIALRMVSDPAPLLRDLLENGRSLVAGRLAGAFRHIGADVLADRILRSMKGVGYDGRETDPFDRPLPEVAAIARPRSPYVARIQAMWATMRSDIVAIFPPAPGLPEDTGAYLAQVEEKYVQDAYHSLSIEGYRVSPQLIEKIRTGQWDARGNDADRETTDALAARGYLEAFRAVEVGIGEILRGADAAAVVRQAHHDWFQALFAPSVQAGLLTAATLAGYRGGPVYIRGSRHVLLPAHAVTDAMEALFDLLAQEASPAVLAVLGHFIFVYIHPYADGNGRMARVLVNALLAGGGFPWTIIHLEHRARYIDAWEEASVNGNILPFASCVCDEMFGSE